MFGNAGEHVGEPCLRINVVYLGGDDQAVHDCGGWPPRSEPGTTMTSPEGDSAHATLGGIVRKQMRPSSRKRVNTPQRLSM